MARKSLFIIFLGVLFFGLISPIFLPALREQAGALEKVKLGSAIKFSAHYYLPVFAAEEKGFWKDNGLDIEWVPFVGATPFMQATAARAINIGLAPTPTHMPAAERGVPVVMVAELADSPPFSIWVRADSPYRHPQDLRGARIGVTGLGAPTHMFARIIVAAHGIEKDVRFVGAGGSATYLAGLKVGSLDAVGSTLGTMVKLGLAGEARELASSADYLPKPWLDQVVLARRDFAQSKPDVVRKMIKAIVQSSDFIRKNPRWALDKMREFQGYSEEAAKLVYDATKLTITGRMDRKAVENVRKVLMEYGIMTEKAPAVDELFTNEYVS